MQDLERWQPFCSSEQNKVKQFVEYAFVNTFLCNGSNTNLCKGN